MAALIDHFSRGRVPRVPERNHRAYTVAARSGHLNLPSADASPVPLSHRGTQDGTAGKRSRPRRAGQVWSLADSTSGSGRPRLMRLGEEDQRALDPLADVVGAAKLGSQSDGVDVLLHGPHRQEKLVRDYYVVLARGDLGQHLAPALPRLSSASGELARPERTSTSTAMIFE